MTNNTQTILREVRSAVLDGHYTHLLALLPALQDAEEGMGREDLAALRALQVEAARTAVCLEAALSGIRAARRRAAEVAQAAKGLTTYDRGGMKATVPSLLPAPRRV